MLIVEMEEKILSMQPNAHACGLPVQELPQQSDTHWVCNHRAVKVFTTRFQNILSTLSELTATGGGNAPKKRVEAKGLLLQLSSVDPLFA